MKPLLTFTARTVHGAGRGKALGTPTINLQLEDVPDALEEGVYATAVHLEGQSHMGALHYGKRPTFDGSVACEVHVLHETIDLLPEQVDITVCTRLRDVQTFETPAKLQEQISADCAAIEALNTL